MFRNGIPMPWPRFKPPGSQAGDPGLANNLGQTYVALGRYDDAIASFRLGGAHAPDHPRLTKNLIGRHWPDNTMRRSSPPAPGHDGTTNAQRQPEATHRRVRPRRKRVHRWQRAGESIAAQSKFETAPTDIVSVMNDAITATTKVNLDGASPSDSEILTVLDVARFLRVPKSTVYKLARLGQLAGFQNRKALAVSSTRYSRLDAQPDPAELISFRESICGVRKS
jgi:hypothetical protein